MFRRTQLAKSVSSLNGSLETLNMTTAMRDLKYLLFVADGTTILAQHPYECNHTFDF